MNKKAGFKIIVYLLLYLIISLSFVIPIVSAEILSVSIVGKESYEGFISGKNDHVNMTFKTDIPINKKDALINLFSKQVNPTSCITTDDGKSICNYISTAGNRNAKIEKYSIRINNPLANNPIITPENNGENGLNDAAALSFIKQGSFIIDDKIPIINSFTVNKAEKELTISYDVADESCNNCESCSGIQKINILDGNEIIKSIVIEPQDKCSLQGTFSENIDSLLLDSGKHDLCMIAIDNVGLFSKKNCIAAEFDEFSPAINIDTFKIMLAGTQKIITAIGDKAIKVDIAINISDNNLALNKVLANFGSLNPAYAESLQEIEAECKKKQQNLYTCSWKDISLNPDEENLGVKITAQDTAGNINSVELTYSLGKDVDAPEVIDFVIGEQNIDGSLDGKDKDKPLYLHNGENKLSIVIKDQTGMANNNLFITSSFFERKQVEKCIFNGQYWLCNFTIDVNKDSGTGYLRITEESKDDIGNSLQKEIKKKIIIDSENAKIKETSYSSACAVANAEYIITISANDISQIFLAADTTKISDIDVTYGDCKQTEEESSVYNDPAQDEKQEENNNEVTAKMKNYECTFSLSKITTAPGTASIFVNITDSAGNVAESDVSINVCATEETTAPNFVKISIGQASKVDRRTLSYANTPTQIPVQFSKKGNVKIIEKTAECNVSSNAYFFKNSDNKNSNTADMLLVELLQQSIDDAVNTKDSMEIGCIISMTIIRDQKLYSIQEQDNIIVSVPLYGNALGTAGEAMKNKIDKVNSEIAEVDESISDWEGVNDFLNFLCSLAETINIIDSILQAVKTIIYGVVLVLSYYPATAGAARSVWNAICSPFDIIHGTVTKYIWPPIIPYPLYPGHLFRYACLLYSCKICSANLYAEIAVSVASYALSSGSADAKSDSAPTSPKPADESTNLPVITTHAVAAGGAATGNQYIHNPTQYALGGPGDDGTAWLFNPYKSIYYAQGCLCLPGLIYNWKKEKQIKCIYRKCLEDTAKNGLTPDICDTHYTAQECLYVESAQVKKYGLATLANMFTEMLKYILSNIVEIALSLTYTTICSNYYNYGEDTNKCSMANIETDGAMSAFCGVTGAAIASMELYSLFNNPDNIFSVSRYGSDLEGVDYCNG